MICVINRSERTLFLEFSFAKKRLCDENSGSPLRPNKNRGAKGYAAVIRPSQSGGILMARQEKILAWQNTNPICGADK
jgi:hypothetical protein